MKGEKIQKVFLCGTCNSTFNKLVAPKVEIVPCVDKSCKGTATKMARSL